MADKKSNLTSYDRKFIACIVFCAMSLGILSTSLFGLYYLERYTNFQDYMKLNEKRYAVLKRDSKKIMIQSLGLGVWNGIMPLKKVLVQNLYQRGN